MSYRKFNNCPTNLWYYLISWSSFSHSALISAELQLRTLLLLQIKYQLIVERHPKQYERVLLYIDPRVIMCINPLPPLLLKELCCKPRYLQTSWIKNINPLMKVTLQRVNTVTPKDQQTSSPKTSTHLDRKISFMNPLFC